MFWNILKRNFGKDLRDAYFSASYEVTRNEGVEWMLRQYRYKCYTSHCIRLSSIPVIKNHQMIAFSFIRDPVEKFLSYYFYTRGHDVTHDLHPTKQYKLSTFLDLLLNEPSFSRLPLDVSQSRFIHGDMLESESNYKVEQLFGKYHIFATELFDDAMIILEKTYPEHFKDCSYGKRLNHSKHDQTVTEQDLQKIQNLPWIEKDKKLHQYSLESTRATLRTAFGDNKAIERVKTEFLKRCQAKKQQWRPSFCGRVKKSLNILLKD